MSGQALHWDRQWRGVLVLLTAAGLGCARGWPPRHSHGLRCFGVLVTVVRVAQNVAVVWSLRRRPDSDWRYGELLCVYEMLIKCGASVVTQVTLLRRCEHVCRLTKCMLRYCSDEAPLSDWGALAMVGPAFGATVAILMVVSIWSMGDCTAVEFITYLLGDYLPSLVLIFFQVMQLVLLSVLVGFSNTEGRRVRAWIVAQSLDQSAEQSPCKSLDKSLNLSSDVTLHKSPVESPAQFLDRCHDRLLETTTPAQKLRGLRLRQQLLHDMVVEASSAFGWCGLASLLYLVMEAVLCLYLGVAYYRMQTVKTLTDPQIQSLSSMVDNPWLFLWGILEVFMFVSTCFLGQRLTDEHNRMYCDLQGYTVACPQICRDTKQEVYGFAQQLQRQDNRCGIFELLYYDTALLKAGMASIVTYMIVLCQFEPPSPNK